MIRAALILCLMGLPALADDLPSNGGFWSVEADAAAQLRSRIKAAWSVGSLSPEAALARVNLRVDFDAAGRVRDVVLESSNAPTKAAAEEAFAVARRAVLHVDADGGLGLPADMIKDPLILTFDPVEQGLS